MVRVHGGAEASSPGGAGAQATKKAPDGVPLTSEKHPDLPTRPTNDRKWRTGQDATANTYVIVIAIET